jgi:hypothetical protein
LRKNEKVGEKGIAFFLSSVVYYSSEAFMAFALEIFPVAYVAKYNPAAKGWDEPCI